MALHVLDEANRCLGCKKPMCQEGCPIHTNIPEVIRLLKANQMDDAGRMLFENNPLTTVRYPRARMRRLAMDAALGYTVQTPALPPYLHLLGARKEALPLPGETALPLSHSLARLARENETCAQMAAAQSRASDLGALCRAKPEPMGGIYRQKIIFLTN